MRTVPLGKRSGFFVPTANFGTMRLPRDLGDAVALVRHAIDSGMRYIDTSRGYGEAEWVLGRALRDGYRDKVILSTKWAPWITMPRPDDDAGADRTRRRIEESISRLGVEYLDYYQVWNINSREAWEKAVAPGGMVEGIRRAIRDGLVRRTGFTTHDTPENVIDYIGRADWCDIILFTYNLLGRKYAPAIEAAHRKGIGTLVMNPVGGGVLAGESEVLAALAREVGARDAPEMSIRWILSNPAVSAVISGISRPPDVDDTIRAAELGPFTPGEMARINRFLESRAPEKSGFCTACRYCLPCPAGIDIPGVMRCIDQARNWGLVARARAGYAGLKGPKADACKACRECQNRCTRQLDICGEMKWAAGNLVAEEESAA